MENHLKYLESASLIVEYLINLIINKCHKTPSLSWERGAVHIVNRMLLQGIPAEKILEHINKYFKDATIIQKPSEIFNSLNLPDMTLILIDENGEKRDPKIWGDFVENIFIPPDNSKSIFFQLKEEETNRVLYGAKNGQYDNYFRKDGFLIDEYSFISGIFNEKNSKCIKKP